MARRGGDAFQLFHLRYFPLFAVFLFLGIFCVSVSYIAAAIVMVVALLLVVALALTKSVKHWVAALLMGVMLLGFGSASYALYSRNKVGVLGFVQVTCRARSVSDSTDGYVVVADKLRVDGKSYSGGVKIYTDVLVQAGDTVSASGNIAIDEVVLDDLYEALKYRTGTKYVMMASVCETTAGKEPLAARIRNKLRETLLKWEGENAGGFSYAMLFGDTSYMDHEEKSALRAVGAAHIFAVSGLHVGVLAAAILFLLNKLKAKRWVKILVLFPILAFYAYLADFTPSVLRAGIMIMVYLFASMLGMRYDDISSLSFAAILILIVKPLYLFDMSFIMSFLSLFGIASLASPLEKIFRKWKIPGKISSGLALSVSTSVAILPVSAMIFGSVSLIGILCNVVVVPLASLAYILTVIILPLTLLFAGFGAALSAISFLPSAVAEIGKGANAINVTGSHDFYAWELMLYYAMIGFVGKYSLARRKVKWIVGGCMAAVFIILLFLV